MSIHPSVEISQDKYLLKDLPLSLLGYGCMLRKAIARSHGNPFGFLKVELHTAQAGLKLPIVAEVGLTLLTFLPLPLKYSDGRCALL